MAILPTLNGIGTAKRTPLRLHPYYTYVVNAWYDEDEISTHTEDMSEFCKEFAYAMQHSDHVQVCYKDVVVFDEDV